MIAGYYYLHSDSKDLIYKRGSDSAADIRDSDFALHLWPVDPQDRASAWDILVEAGALGAKPERVDDLARQWGCDDQDADVYASVRRVTIDRDGSLWCATGPNHTDLMETSAGFGESKLLAMIDLCKSLGMRPAKMWGPTFATLLRDEVAS